MQTRRIDTRDRGDVARFVEFPFTLYKSSPYWVPPLVSEARQELDRDKHPFYRHSTADFFLAEEDGRVLGRLMVLENSRYNAFQQTRTAFFGHFDAINDPLVSRALFASAFQWARERNLEAIKGPKELMGVNGGGVLVEGFEHMPSMGMPYNDAYYDKLIQDAGLTKAFDSLSGFFRSDHQVPERFFQIAEKAKARRGYRIHSFRSQKEMRRWVPRATQVFCQAFKENTDFFPPSDAEMAAFAEMLIHITEPGMIKLVLKGDEIVGFIFAYPNISRGLIKARGRLWPMGWYHILREKKRTRWADVNGVGVLPGHQGLGASIVLYAEVANTLRNSRFDVIDVVQVEETNQKSRSALEEMGVTWHKRHRSYVRNL